MVEVVEVVLLIHLLCLKWDVVEVEVVELEVFNLLEVVEVQLTHQIK